MNVFKQHWTALKSKNKLDLANKLSTTKGYLSQIAHGQRSPGKHFKIALLNEVDAMNKIIDQKEVLKND